MEDEAERIVGLYRRHARAWAADRGNTLTESAWLDRFLALLPPGGAVLDIGCGSAEPIGRYLIEKGHPVTGADSSPELIGICGERFPLQDWRVADMRTLSLGRASTASSPGTASSTSATRTSAGCSRSSGSTPPPAPP